MGKRILQEAARSQRENFLMGAVELGRDPGKSSHAKRANISPIYWRKPFPVHGLLSVAIDVIHGEKSRD